jgi:hypothetical protein
MTTNTNSNNYPFATRAQIKAELDASFDVRCWAMTTLYHLQTNYEQDNKKTVVKNRTGFMSSHAVNGTRVALKLLSKEELDQTDVDLINKIAPRYSHQLAVIARDAALETDPTLAEKAAVFFSNK